MKKSYYLLIVLLFIVYIGTGSSNSLLGSAWPAISADVGVPIAWESIIIVITYIAAAIGSATAQNLLERLRTWAPLTFGILLIAVAVFWFSASHRFFMLPAAGALLGYFFGMQGSLINSYAAKYYKAIWMSWLHCFYAFGNALGPAVISWFLIHTGSWRLGYQAVGFIVIVISVLLAASFPLWRIHGAVLPKRKAADGEPPASSDVKAQSNRVLLRLPGGTIIPVTMFFYCSFEVVMGLWTASYMTQEKGFTPGAAAGMVAFFFGAQVAGRIAGGFISIKVSDRMIVRVAMIVATLGTVAFLLAPDSLILLSIIVLGAASGPIFPLAIHEVPSIVGAENAQGVIGLQIAAANGGTAIVPVLVGVIANYTGFSIFPVFLIALMGAAVILKTVQDRAAAKREANSEQSRAEL
ncbi:MAG: MFS transporter [Clostridiales bacterium]|nr:MFS transporter [Clostridiales bacterium]